ncbi:unnamed protein product [Hyaloperonospora brassicae]|uniref:VPS9 domain-containing protein n=1 Tax=Hyaloperonospora brassicae TaxID=162125 RepID=A0AAV0UXV5_HYABA|nr:unnamed protein product [Hyaloperonospora brassicae]
MPNVSTTGSSAASRTDLFASSSVSFADPFHGHSFFPLELDALSAIDRSLVLFRHCSVCHERLLTLYRPGTTLTATTSTAAALVVSATRTLVAPHATTRGICQCLACGVFVHRSCASFAHLHRYCRGHARVVPVCSHVDASAADVRCPDAVMSLQDREKRCKTGTKARAGVETFTLAALIDELDGSAVVRVNSRPSPLVGENATPKQQHLETASKFVKMLVPVVAAGGVVGAFAVGPSVAVLAGLNMLITSVGAETVMAGIGLTASAAAAATVTHQSKVKAVKRSKERLRKGEWAMEICWNCMKNFAGAASDDACRKDAEFLRRFQRPRSRYSERKQQSPTGDVSADCVGVGSSNEERLTPRETVPDDAEVYRFLFGLFASPGELLGQMNVQLCEAFRKRYTDRHRKRLRRSSFTGKSSSARVLGARAMAKDTLQDTKMYVAHVLGATLQCLPSLASTPESISSCTLAVERIIYDDIHAMVFSEFQSAFKEAETAFADNLADIRREQSYHSSPLLRLPRSGQEGDGNNRTAAFQHPVLADDLQKAEAQLVVMMQETSSPLLKLVLLCDAFRNICCFAEKLHQSASNTDLLIPILCAFFVECPSVCHAGSSFVAEIAFISFFTNGGGKGVEGYVLTTLQAAIQVIVAVDVPNGHAKELELFAHDNDSEATDEADVDDREFFDAVSIPT